MILEIKIHETIELEINDKKINVTRKDLEILRDEINNIIGKENTYTPWQPWDSYQPNELNPTYKPSISYYAEKENKDV